jgi:DNA-binding NtrC family response regulator
MTEKAKVLFVDDEERIVKLLKFMFQSLYTVFTANSGKAALDIIDANKIDVIVSDQRMPGMSGIDLLVEVRKRSPGTIRILLTGYSDLVAIIGAVNEGEVYRFLNKPWSQEEIKATLAECVKVAMSSSSEDFGRTQESSQPFSIGSAPLASAAKLLALDGVAMDRHEVMEMFTKDYDVLGASSISEALDIIELHNVGVVVTDTRVNGENTAQLLSALKQHVPYITTVVLSDLADSNMVVNLINQAQIYRFAMKPIQPNIFRLAVSAAMREHYRLRADPRLIKNKPVLVKDDADNSDIADRIINSLSRFTQIRQGSDDDN